MDKRFLVALEQGLSKKIFEADLKTFLTTTKEDYEIEKSYLDEVIENNVNRQTYDEIHNEIDYNFRTGSKEHGKIQEKYINIFLEKNDINGAINFYNNTMIKNKDVLDGDITIEESVRNVENEFQKRGLSIEDYKNITIEDVTKSKAR